jgi:hypothetical protein
LDGVQREGGAGHPIPDAGPRRDSRSPQRQERSLAEQGVDLSGEQQTKIKTALEYFSQNLTAAATS